jgi:hypothetical protein
MTTGKLEQIEISILKDKAYIKSTDPLSDSDIARNFVPVQYRGYSDRIKIKLKKKGHDLCKVGV